MTLPWFIWIWLAWLAFCAFGVINGIGRPRQAVTPGQASYVVAVLALQAWALVTVSA